MSAPPHAGASPEDDLEEVDPRTLVPSDQSIVHMGHVWKLNSDGDPANPDHWLRRQMWLVNSGGLFYYSRKHKGPVGRPIRGLSVKAVSHETQAYAFELAQPPLGSLILKPTTLAAETAAERDQWISAMDSFMGHDALDLFPLDSYTKGSSTRMNRPSLPGGYKPMVATVSDVPEEPGTPGGTMSSAVAAYSRAGGVHGTNVFSVPVMLQEIAAKKKASKASPPHSPTGVPKRESSQMEYAEPDHTVLVLDWDDTVFPTTWVREDCNLNWRLSVDQQLEPSPRKTLIKGLLSKHEAKAYEFLTEAVQLANVFIVTLARRPWVETSSTNFAPALQKTIEELGLKVLYAQEFIDDKLSAEYSKDDFKSQEQASDFWTKVKSRVISMEIEDYHRRMSSSWKNIISFGDSDFERYGTQAAVEEYLRKEMAGGKIVRTGATAEGISKDGVKKKLRTKTLKMLSEPTVEEMTAELSLLTIWIPFMVKEDEGFDIEIDSTDDDSRLMQLHKKITGKDEKMSWSELAGMTS